MPLLHLLLSNTDSLQQFEDYVWGRTWQLKTVKNIYRFHNLVFDREDSSLERFNQATPAQHLTHEVLTETVINLYISCVFKIYIWHPRELYYTH
jgi:hypothetical protein